MSQARSVSITVDVRQVSGLLQVPSQARACYVLAHGAGAGMAHPFMVAVADGLAERGIATLRYQVPYMEQGSSGRTCRNLPKRRSRCSYSSIPSGPEACLRRRRHIVWGSYDITGTGRSLSRCISNARRKPTRVSSPSHREQGHYSDPKKILSFVTTG